MRLLLATIRNYWKLLIILFTASTALAGGAAWVNKVDGHVSAGNEAMKEFKQSQIERARTDVKVDILLKTVEELKQETNQKLDRIERKLDRR